MCLAGHSSSLNSHASKQRPKTKCFHEIAKNPKCSPSANGGSWPRLHVPNCPSSSERPAEQKVEERLSTREQTSNVARSSRYSQPNHAYALTILKKRFSHLGPGFRSHVGQSWPARRERSISTARKTFGSTLACSSGAAAEKRERGDSGEEWLTRKKVPHMPDGPEKVERNTACTKISHRKLFWEISVGIKENIAAFLRR